MSICAALFDRGRTGVGAFLDVSVADGVLQLMALHIEDHLATGVHPGHRHTVTTGRYACYDTYQASDGGWITVAAIEPKFWANFCDLIGLPHWAKSQTDDALQDQIRAEVAAVIRTKTRDEWVAWLAPEDTCVAPVLSVEELVKDAQFNARRDFPLAHHPSAGDFRQLGPTLGGQLRDDEYQLREGDVTDTDELLTRAGLSAEEIAKLHEAGAIQ
jgi:alpha-methylacyl-CoA racemase